MTRRVRIAIDNASVTKGVRKCSASAYPSSRMIEGIVST
jgi:hypothetical protein